MKVLVAGGTGRLGTVLVHDLAGRGVEVRVLTRNPVRAAHLQDVAEIAIGDVRDPSSLSPALSGAEVVVSAVHGFAGPGRVSPQTVDRVGSRNLFAAAAGEHADIVMVSVFGASPDSQMELFRCKWAAEQYLKNGSTPWTIVQATAFVELWADILKTRVIFGRGNNPINFVSVKDVAVAVRDAVLDRSTRGQTLTVTGPDNLTFNELAERLDQGGDPGRKIRHIPRPVLKALAPLHRQPKAALAMDTVDMTAPPGRHPDGAPSTPIQEVLAQRNRPTEHQRKSSI